MLNIDKGVKRSRGRPKIDDLERQEVTVTFRTSKSMYREIHSIAEKEGKMPSDWLRHLVLEAIMRDLEKSMPKRNRK